MKKSLYIAIAFIIITSLFSCSIETSDNGALDGFWHLERIDTIDNGGVRDLSDTTLFWSFQYHLLQLTDNKASYYIRFRQTKDSLILHKPYINYISPGEGQGEDIPIERKTLLEPFGIEDLEVHYKKDVLKGSRMVLSSKRLRLYFRKY